MAKFLVITFKPFLCSPAVVPAFNDEINFFELVLAHIPTEHPTSALACNRVSSVHSTAPHVSDPVSIDGRVGTWLTNKGIVQGHSVPLATHACPVYINP